MDIVLEYGHVHRWVCLAELSRRVLTLYHVHLDVVVAEVTDLTEELQRAGVSVEEETDNVQLISLHALVNMLWSQVNRLFAAHLCQ